MIWETGSGSLCLCIVVSCKPKWTGYLEIHDTIIKINLSINKKNQFISWRTCMGQIKHRAVIVEAAEAEK